MAFFKKFIDKICDDDRSKVSKEYIYNQWFEYIEVHLNITTYSILVISPWFDIQWVFHVSSQGSKGGPAETAYFGTVKPDPNFNAQNDAAKLKKAIETKGKYFAVNTGILLILNCA